ncbi:TET8 [Linum grandiflorum]
MTVKVPPPRQVKRVEYARQLGKLVLLAFFFLLGNFRLSKYINSLLPQTHSSNEILPIFSATKTKDSSFSPTMFRLSNNLVGILNFITFLLSIPIIWAGAWLRNHGSSECDRFLDTPIIVIGVFLMLVSLAGLVGACCKNSCLLWIYLVVMFLLIVLLFCFTIFAFVVTNKGAGQALSNRGYKEYRLGGYSDWLQKRVTSTKNWNKIRSCLIDAKVCSKFNETYLSDSVEKFYTERLSSLQSGCCKPADECGFTYTTTNSTNTDCNAWENQADVLCFNCNSCKAGLLDNIKRDWKRVAIVNIVFLVFLIIVYSVGCCAFRNNRRDNSYSSGFKA